MSSWSWLISRAAYDLREDICCLSSVVTIEKNGSFAGKGGEETLSWMLAGRQKYGGGIERHRAGIENEVGCTSAMHFLLKCGGVVFPSALMWNRWRR